MTRYLRLVGVTALVAVLLGAMQLVGSGGAARADGAAPTFGALTPAPFTTVAPGPVTIGAHATGSAPLSDVTLQVDGQQIAQTGSQVETFQAISKQQTLSAGTHTASVEATDANGNQFRAEWDFVVSNNLGDGEWFTANGTPKADQINATIKSLVEAFRWHLYGLSWDGANHPDLPTHVGLQGTGAPLTPWVTGTTFDASNTDATLRSLVEAFRWHFWGISWDGQAHCDVPTHADCHQPQPPQPIDPWFVAAPGGEQPIPANITATLRSLVESFRWHFWGYSWDGAAHADIPTHGTFHVAVTPTPSPSPTEGPPAEGGSIFASKLSDTDQLNIAGNGSWATIPDGFTMTLGPGQENGATVNNLNIGDASYSVDVQKLNPEGESIGCLLLRTPQFGASGNLYAFCLVYNGNAAAQAFAATASMVGSTVDLGADLADFNFDPALHADGQHQLKVIAQGNRLWFFVDGNYLWTLENSGPTSGTAGFWGYNAYSVYQTLQFSYLSVKALAP